MEEPSEAWIRHNAAAIESYGPGMPEPEPAPPGIEWPKALDLTYLATVDPTPPHFLVSDWLPAGYATLIAGHGGAGKSAIALTLAVCIAAGRPWWGIATERRRVLVLSCEDRADVLHWRLRRICDHLGVDLAGLDGWLQILDLVGHDTILWRPDDDAPPAFDVLADRMRSADLLLVDGVTDTFGGNENARTDVKAYVNRLLSLVSPETGAVLLVGHVNKPAAAGGAGSEGYSGSTAWHNAVRARWYLWPEVSQGDGDDAPKRTGALTLELQKSNLGRADSAIEFRWNDEAGMFVGALPETGAVASIRERVERESIIAAMRECLAKDIPVPAAMQGQRTAFHVLSATGKLDHRLCAGPAGVRRFRRRIEELRQMQNLREASIRRANRHSMAVLVLESEAAGEVRQCAE